jgi:hypothetical protein
MNFLALFAQVSDPDSNSKTVYESWAATSTGIKASLLFD